MIATIANNTTESVSIPEFINLSIIIVHLYLVHYSSIWAISHVSFLQEKIAASHFVLISQKWFYNGMKLLNGIHITTNLLLFY